MSEVKLGQLIDANSQRDAVHVAIAPMIAAEKLQPGQHVGFPSDDRDRVSGNCDLPIGIVDPFLKWAVMPGERFYVMLYPNTVTSLRHEWTHPAFGEKESSKAVSEQWLKVLAESVGVSYGRLMDGAKDWIDTHDNSWPDRLVGGGEMEGVSTPPEFWQHYENVTGVKVPEDARRSFFSCSC